MKTTREEYSLHKPISVVVVAVLNKALQLSSKLGPKSHQLLIDIFQTGFQELAHSLIKSCFSKTSTKAGGWRLAITIKKSSQVG
jgi:hypothetical protein